MEKGHGKDTDAKSVTPYSGILGILNSNHVGNTVAQICAEISVEVGDEHVSIQGIQVEHKEGTVWAIGVTWRNKTWPRSRGNRTFWKYTTGS